MKIDEVTKVERWGPPIDQTVYVSEGPRYLDQTMFYNLVRDYILELGQTTDVHFSVRGRGHNVTVHYDSGRCIVAGDIVVHGYFIPYLASKTAEAVVEILFPNVEAHNEGEEIE
jgi:hypothetical protein